MKIPSNKLVDIKWFIHKSLADIYDSKEIEAFYFLLIDEFAKISKLKAISDPQITINQSELLKINFAIKDLKNSKPIQYIIGKTSFFDLEFFVNDSVLIPRQETEEIVNWILEDNKEIHEPISILDIGTGSGCIAISLKKHFSNVQVSAIDISEKALETAKKNADLNNIEINFLKLDILNPPSNLDLGQFDIIVSNPPYITQSEKTQMRANVLNFEPELALFVDDQNPLQFYKAIADFSIKNLKSNGKLYFEINEKYGELTSEMLFNKGLIDIQLKKDINKKPRMIRCGTKFD
jgi:release factor glutamine methyltransferase